MLKYFNFISEGVSNNRFFSPCPRQINVFMTMTVIRPSMSGWIVSSTSIKWKKRERFLRMAAAKLEQCRLKNLTKLPDKKLISPVCSKKSRFRLFSLCYFDSYRLSNNYKLVKQMNGTQSVLPINNYQVIEVRIVGKFINYR